MPEATVKDLARVFRALSDETRLKLGPMALFMMAAESVGTPDAPLGPIIVVDRVVGYGWMGVLLLFGPWQKRFDTWAGARTGAIEDTNRRLAELDRDRHPTTVRPAAFLIGMGVGAAVLSVNLGARLPALESPTMSSCSSWRPAW